MAEGKEQKSPSHIEDAPGVDVHTYVQPRSAEDFRRASRSIRSCWLLIAANVLYHGALLAWVRLEDSFIEFENWFFVAACLAPPFVTVTIGILLLTEKWLTVRSATIAVTLSVLLAIMHCFLINLAISVV